MEQKKEFKTVTITITTSGGHSSSPHLASNALIIAGQVIKAINAEVAYRFAANQRLNIKPISLKSGTAGNIIPAIAEVQYLYPVCEDNNDKVLNRIFNDIPIGIANIFSADCKIALA